MLQVMQRFGWAGLWGIVGVLALLGQAIARLAPHAFALRQQTLGALEWLVLVGWLAFNGYAEGYRAFHRGFSPRVVERARALRSDRRVLHRVLAPLYCMCLFAAPRRRLIVAWSVTIGVVGIVILVRRLAQPWRGIIDAGVVVGLAWGVGSVVYYALRGRATHVA